MDANNAGKEIIIKGKDVKENISDESANGKGDGQFLTYSPSRESKLTTMNTTPTWHSSTDLYNYYWSVQPRLSTESDSRVGSSPYDIDLIQVRGRVWKDNSRIVDQTDTEHNSADAGVFWQSGCMLCGGQYLGRGNHAYQDAGLQSYYPITEDTLSVG